ncbi:MAG: MFS transporter [Chloroflexi bacterium]|nr:MFS transporter [Chloroflexota bacterium]MBI3167285.1 MFS transporter [Chloroflexota bacterium]
MTKEHSRYRWFVVAVFFFFMLLHQTDKLMIGSLQVQISNDFNINNKQWGLVNSGALIVATILYPIWGYLYDRFSRTKLLSLASLVWGSTTWLNALVRSFGGFLTTRASTGIDDSSYPGLYTLIADYFGPTQRGKIFGILQLAQPIGYLLGMILALMVAPAIGGWRSVFYITGSLGLIIAILIFFGVKEIPRGQAEPEFENITEMQAFKFSWMEAREIFKKKTMWFVFLQGFAGVFPWNVITFFFFAYLERERGYDADSILFTMAPVILILAGGYFLGGALGDYAFKRTNKGRIIVSCVGVFMGALFMYLAITTPIEAKNQFFIFMCLTAIFMPLSSTNVTATVYDVTVPEVRSTAQAVEYFIENAGAAFAPIITGVIADMYDLKTAILLICTVAWGLCFFFYLGALFTIDKDSHNLRNQMAERAKSM